MKLLLPTLKPRSSDLWTWLFAVLAYHVAFCRPMRFVFASRPQSGLLPLVPLTGVLQVCAGGWLESARCPCAYVMNICMRSPACALFSQPRSCGEWTPSRPCQSASQVHLIHSTPARVQVKTMGRSRLPWSVVGFQFTLLAGRASGIRGSSRSETCLRIAFSRPRSFASLFLAPAPRRDMLPKKLPDSAPATGPAQHLPSSALC